MPHELELILVGALAGVVGGLLGVGGGIVMIPALVFLMPHEYGPDSFHLYKLAAIATSVVVSAPAARRHALAHAVVFRMLPGLLPLAVLGTIIGVVASSFLSGELTVALKRLFGVFLELVVAFNLYLAWRSRHGESSLRDYCPLPTRRGKIGLIVGLPAGVIAGMLGIGGGVWAVPAQRLFLGIRLRNAIANSSLLVVAIAASTAVSQSVAVAALPSINAADGWYIALWLAPGALLGGWFGAGLTHRLPVAMLRHIFHALLVLAGVRLIFSS